MLNDLHNCRDTADMAHFGSTIKTLREAKGWSQKELAQLMGATDESISKWEQMPEARMRGTSYAKLARALGLDPGGLDALWREPADLDGNVEPYGEYLVPEIPTFDLPIAAGPWLELADVEEMRDQLILKDGRFRVRIRGDSMEKEYPDGSLIEFRCQKPDCGDGKGSKLEIGGDYYVQRAESATFKRLKAFDNEMLVFISINKKKYPHDIRVLRADVVRMAKAEWVLSRAGSR